MAFPPPTQPNSSQGLRRNPEARPRPGHALVQPLPPLGVRWPFSLGILVFVLILVGWAWSRLFPPSEPVQPRPQPGEERAWEIAPGVSMIFCWVPPGTAQLGCPLGEKGATADETEAERGKYTSKGFWLGTYTVTQQEWAAVMDGHNPSAFSKGGDCREKVAGLDTSRFPVERVSWEDCQELLLRLNQRADGSERVFGRRGRFVLPHEDEWEYACRGGLGNRQPFYFGSVLDGRQANCNGTIPYGTETAGPNRNRPAPGGQLRPGRSPPVGPVRHARQRLAMVRKYE